MVSRSEYGDLKTVVLGVAENYIPHVWGWKNESFSMKNFELALKLVNTTISDQIRSEVISDLDAFENQLKSLSIEVLRPPRDNFETYTATPHHISYGNDFYNIRDLQIVIDDILLTAAPASPSRIAEVHRLKPFLSQIALKYDLKVLNCELPVLDSNPIEEFFYNGQELDYIENFAGTKLGGDYPDIWHRLKEKEILFDAANIARFNKNLVFLVSSTGNKLAYRWLSSVFAEKQDISCTDLYRSSHIDSTIIPLSDDLVLVNSKRVNPSNIPSVLKQKNVIYYDQVAPIPQGEIEFHGQRKIVARQIQDLGFNSNLWEMSSPWAGLNLLVLKNNFVAVESRQIELIRRLEEADIDVMPVNYRHPYTFLGGLHCTTLDINRI